MKLGEIKIEALRLMFATHAEEICIEDLAELGGQENYRDYLVNMNGAINRCFSDIENKRVLPVKSFVLKPSDVLASTRRVRFDLSVLLPDFFDIARVICDGDDYYEDCAYQMEGQTLILSCLDSNAEYRLLYYPRLTRLTERTTDFDEMAVPEEIAAFIPYFIKGDLYREDEPNEAGEARNWYEAAMEQVKQSRIGKTNRVSTVYSQV